MRERRLLGPSRRGAIVAACLCVMALGTARAADPGTEVVARLGTQDITVAALQSFVRGLDPRVRKQALADTQVMNQLIRAEIERMAVLRQAKAKDWEKRPEVAAQMERARDQVVVATYLASVAAPPNDFPTDAQIQQAYDMNRDNFMLPRQYELQQIYIALPTGDDKKAEAAAQQKAEDLARKAKAKNANFADLARANSEHKESAARGGDLGWVPEPQLTPEIRGQVAGMSQGDVSDPIRSADGWHVIRLVDTKAAAPRPLAEVKDTIIAALRQRQEQANEQAYVARLVDKTPIAVNEIGLKKIFDSAP